MRSLIDNLSSLGTTRLAALASIGLGLVFALLFGVGTVMSPSFVPLYNNLSVAAASQVVSTLEQAGFKVEVSGGGSTVSVDQDQIPRARMALAEGGLPNEGVPGWELFDQSNGVGMNSFMQKISRLRALEGELARSIQSLSSVKAARVHLVLPEREAFSRVKPAPSASVIVRSRSNAQISQRQALAVRALVAAAVPEMTPDQVTVISSNGEALLMDGKEGTAGATMDNMGNDIEGRLVGNISNILMARVGAGNVRVQATVTLNRESKIVKTKSFDPDQRVVRSTESSEESSSDGNSGNPPVDIGNNLPEDLGGNIGSDASSSETASTREVVNYEIGNSDTETIRQAGDIERISVAVLVNGLYTVDEQGVSTYQERSQPELDRLRQLIESASGFDQARGDSITVESMQFMDYNDGLNEPVGVSFSQMLSENLTSILRGVFAIGLVGAVLMLGVRPTLKLMLEAPAPVTESTLLVEDVPPANGGVQLASAGAQGAVPLQRLDDNLPPLIVNSSSDERQRISAFTNIVEQEPEESMKIINHWLTEKA
ncbi:MAG: flagellar M-ring protein FliF [Rhodobacteraceae bacterium]|nr:flagellar M-ring protein FliF [Paracoccaceae bacterium]